MEEAQNGMSYQRRFVVKPEYHKMPDGDSWFDKAVFMSKIPINVHVKKYTDWKIRVKTNAADAKMFWLCSNNIGTYPSQNATQ